MRRFCIVGNHRIGPSIYTYRMNRVDMFQNAGNVVFWMCHEHFVQVEGVLRSMKPNKPVVAMRELL